MESQNLPDDIRDKMEHFDESLQEVEDVFKPFLKVPITDLREKFSDPLQNARLDLMVAYTANSLFWTYLVTQGIDPKEHPIKDELIRIKNHMAKLQSIQDKKKMSRVDTNAAKRFVRNALWQPDEKGDATQNNSSSQQDSPRSSKSHKKRKRTEESQKKKKKKKKKED
ncbi:nuclear nucleic acid-binding protein C1D-like [Hydractinia symbiolongicarpus]|uniref:nuclear nucleic acid-binding protein C1D-like n=1 Tax=Hydractinia symbiolongicarpus TaxID=13093 RepID=UPI00254DF07B|nr:nuclear nucleic acid-binding protein C1D-like [Hydractinia symbiolongicarpus]